MMQIICQGDQRDLNSSDSEVEYSNHHFERPLVANTEITIFLDRLIAIFEKLMTQLEFAATVPSILSLPQLLDSIGRRDLREIITTFLPFSYFIQNHEASKCHEIEDYENRENQEGSSPNFNLLPVCNTRSGMVGENSNIRTALHILYSYKIVRKTSQAYVPQISSCTVNFFRQLGFFLEFVLSRTKLTPEEERAEELKIREVQEIMEATRNAISEWTHALEEQKASHKAESEKLSEELEAQMNKWKKINDDFDFKYSEIINRSTEKLEESAENFKLIMEGHQADLANLKAVMEEEAKVAEKMKKDKISKRFKVESQLATSISKYDADMAENDEVFAEVMDRFNVLDRVRAQLIVEEMEQQKMFYDKIVSEREAAELAADLEIAMKFLRNRSAKIIQRWWREILKNKPKAKKKGKARKKSKTKSK